MRSNSGKKRIEYAQAERVLTILHILMTEISSPVSFNFLKQKLETIGKGTGERTLYRDLLFLEDMGYNIRSENSNGYHLGRDSLLRIPRSVKLMKEVLK